MIAVPWSSGAVQLTVISLSPGSTNGVSGASGFDGAAVTVEVADQAPLPNEFTARILTVYDVLLVSPVIVVLVAVPLVSVFWRVLENSWAPDFHWT